MAEQGADFTDIRNQQISEAEAIINQLQAMLDAARIQRNAALDDAGALHAQLLAARQESSTQAEKISQLEKTIASMRSGGEEAQEE